VPWRFSEGPRGPRAAEADVLPGSNPPGAPDLSLHEDSTAKAGALAAFSQAIIAEDNADSDRGAGGLQKALSLDPGYTELAVKVAFGWRAGAILRWHPGPQGLDQGVA